MDFERSRSRAQEVNLTALIDIVFHIMFFVMFTTTFVVSESMELALPSDRATAAPIEEVLRVVIRPGGGLEVNGAFADESALTQALIGAVGANPDTRIVVVSTPGVLVQELVRVMDTVYLAGGRNLQVDQLR